MTDYAFPGHLFPSGRAEKASGSNSREAHPNQTLNRYASLTSTGDDQQQAFEGDDQAIALALQYLDSAANVSPNPHGSSIYRSYIYEGALRSSEFFQKAGRPEAIPEIVVPLRALATFAISLVVVLAASILFLITDAVDLLALIAALAGASLAVTALWVLLDLRKHPDVANKSY